MLWLLCNKEYNKTETDDRNSDAQPDFCKGELFVEAKPIAYFILLDYETNINTYYRYDNKYDDSPMLKPFYHC